MTIDKDLNEENKKKFKRYGAKNPDMIIYKCVICGKDVCIKDSYSNVGHKLICRHCQMQHFKNNFDRMWKWQQY